MADKNIVFILTLLVVCVALFVSRKVRPDFVALGAPPAELRGRQLAGGGMLRALLPALLRALGAERVLCVRVVGAEETRAERSRQAQAVRAATLLSVPPQDADWTLALESKCAPFGVLDTRAMDALFETGYAAAAAALPALWRQEPRPRGKILRFPGMTIEEG